MLLKSASAAACLQKYSVQYQVLASKLQELGGPEGLRRNKMQAAGELRLLIHSKQSSLVDGLEEELVGYENASGIGPFISIRHQELQTAWRKSFLNKEMVTWNEFWRSFPQNLSRYLPQVGTDLDCLPPASVPGQPPCLERTLCSYPLGPGIPALRPGYCTSAVSTADQRTSAANDAPGQ
jgi:hypothetical protein